jgi:hypothetical protein
MRKTTKYPKKHDIVEIIWWDSHAIDGWQLKDEPNSLDEDKLEAKSAGYFIKELANSIVIASSQTDHSYAAMWQIPKIAIKEIRIIKIKS